MNSEHPREEWEKKFDKKFHEGKENSVFCYKHQLLATSFEIKTFISQLLTNQRSHFKEQVEALQKRHGIVYDNITPDGLPAYNAALSDVINEVLTKEEI